MAQASERLDREGTPHRVVMANFKRFQTGYEKIAVCSIDTLMARNEFPEAKLIVLDEADLFQSALFKEFISHYPDAFILAVTATPWIKGSLTHIADTIVAPIGFSDATKQGYLAPLSVYWPEQCQPDVSNVNVSQATGDYVADELAEATLKDGITGSIIEHYHKFGMGARPTVLFAVNIKHSKIMAEKFNANGINAAHIDANTPDSERRDALHGLEYGKVKVLCNVKVLERGVDMPWLKGLLLTKKTLSRNTYIQQIGRGTRTSPGKTDCMVLDFVGNVWEHDLPDYEPPVILDPLHRPEERKQSRLKTCRECFAIYVGTICPGCGAQPISSPSADKKMIEHKGSLVRMKPSDSIPSRLRKLQAQAKKNGYKHTWALFQLADKYGLDAVKSHVPKWFIKVYKEAELKKLDESLVEEILSDTDGAYRELDPEKDLSW